MKRSAQVAAPLLASAALAILAGCRPQEMQRCVDENNKVVADNLCGKPQQGMRSDGHGGFIPFIIPYRYYYGGSGGFGLGSTVGGGAFNPTPGRSYTSPSTRGGFGSTMSGHSGAGAGE